MAIRLVSGLLADHLSCVRSHREWDPDADRYSARYRRRRPAVGSAGSRTRSFCTCQGSVTTTGRPGAHEWRARAYGLPHSELCRHPGSKVFRGSMAGLCTPLPTLRRRLRTARGRRGSLLLHSKGLPPATPCRSPGALRKPSHKRTSHAHFEIREAANYGGLSGDCFFVMSLLESLIRNTNATPDKPWKHPRVPFVPHQLS